MPLVAKLNFADERSLAHSMYDERAVLREDVMCVRSTTSKCNTPARRCQDSHPNQGIAGKLRRLYRCNSGAGQQKSAVVTGCPGMRKVAVVVPRRRE